jgi:hypothetical protein
MRWAFFYQLTSADQSHYAIAFQMTGPEVESAVVTCLVILVHSWAREQLRVRNCC